jgi:hypothetical protein
MFTGSYSSASAREYCGRAWRSLIKKLNEPAQVDEGDLFAAAFLALSAPTEFMVHLRGFKTVMKHLHDRGGRNMFSFGMFWPALRDILFDFLVGRGVYHRPQVEFEALLPPVNYLLEELEPFVGFSCCTIEARYKYRQELSHARVDMLEGLPASFDYSTGVRARFGTSMMLFSQNHSESFRSYIDAFLVTLRGEVNLEVGELLELGAAALENGTNIEEFEGIFDLILLTV